MNSKLLTVSLFISVCLIWGTTWFAMEEALHSIPPIFATGLRFFISGQVLIILAILFNQPLFFPKGKRKWFLIVAVMYFALPFSLMIYGEQYISSGLASLIFANMPIAVMLISCLFLALRLEKHQIFGLITAVISLCLILSNEMNIDGKDCLIGITCLGFAVAIHAIIYVLVQKYCDGIPVLTYNAMPSFAAAFLLFFVSIMFERIHINSFTWESMSAVAYLGVVASVGGIVAYFRLGQVSTPFQASICFLIFPLIAILISCYVSGEVLSKQSLLIMIPLFLGILLTKMPKRFFRTRA